MKLCFPVQENNGLQSQVSRHFGSAPLLLVVDTESREISELKRSAHAEQPGSARLAQLLAGEPIDAMVVSSIGPGAISRLQAAGLKVYQTAGATISDNLLCLDDKRLKEFDAAGLCSQGQHGHGHERGHQHRAGHGCSCH